MTTWGSARRVDDADRVRRGVIAGVLLLLLAMTVADRETQDLDEPRTITGTVIAEDPESVATVTSTPGGDR